MVSSWLVNLTAVREGAGSIPSSDIICIIGYSHSKSFIYSSWLYVIGTRLKKVDVVNAKEWLSWLQVCATLTLFAIECRTQDQKFGCSNPPHDLWEFLQPKFDVGCGLRYDCLWECNRNHLSFHKNNLLLTTIKYLQWHCIRLPNVSNYHTCQLIK